MKTDSARLNWRGVSIVVLTFALSALVLGHPQDSLVGSELRQTTDLESGLESFIGSLIGGGNNSAVRVDKVVVLEDGPGNLTLGITHAGLTGGRVAGEIRDRDRRLIRAIAPARVDVDAASGEVRLSFEMRPDMGPPQAESAYLRLLISQPSRPMPVSLTYRLVKTWSGTGGSGASGGAGVARTIKIAPRPVGTAVQLGPRPNWENAPPPRPPIRVRPDRVVLAPRTTATGTGSPGTTAGTGNPGTAGAPGAVRMKPVGPTVMTAPGPTAAGTQTKPAPGGGQVNQAVIAKTAKVQQALPVQKSRNMMAVQAFKFGVREEDKKQGALGPSDAAIDLLQELSADNVGLTGDEILMVSPIVYQDQNPDSGIFYFIPRGYRTEWSAEAGYGLRMLYGASKGAEAGEVAVAARLDAGVNLQESRLVHDLLAAYVKRHPQPQIKFVGVRPLPIDQVEVSLASGLQQYSIPPEKIATVAISDILGQIEISCVTDAVNKESLQLALVEDIGLNGFVKFTPSGGKLAPQQIPLRLRLADSDTFGTLAWRRDEQLYNRTLYPLALTYLHALVVDPRDGTPIVYSWDLGSAEVAPGGRVEWDGSRVPAWIERDAKRVWVQYRPLAKCRPCDEKVIAEVTGGVVAVSTSQLVFRTITPIADFGAYELTINVRSRHFDPQGQQVIQKSVIANADGEDFPIGPLYVGESTQGTIAEYSIDVTMKDGTIHAAKRWLRADRLRVTIGSSQIRESTGLNPSENKGEPQ